MKKIYVAGHNGMVGKAICRKLLARQDIELITRSRSQLNLCDQNAVREFMKSESPDEVILAAATVGGIYANNAFPAEFIYENLQIQNNVIDSAHHCDVQKLLFLGSSCIYPKNASQPIFEKSLLSGYLEATNEPYAIAKIAGIKMCESYNRQFGRDYRSVMPTNLYGPGDSYHLENSHVIAALIRRFYEAKLSDAKETVVWGSGKPLREFLFVDDMADASLFVHDLSKKAYQKYTRPMQSHVNIGSGVDITIKELAEIIRESIGFLGRITFDTNKPDGTMRKLMDVRILSKLGWQPKISLKQGIDITVSDFLKNLNNMRY